MMMEGTEARRNYQREYRARNRERINTKRREWNRRNPDKSKEYQARYWEQKGQKQGLRAPWSAYGIRTGQTAEIGGYPGSGQLYLWRDV